ncbi:hypothetical protein BT96DRAFT_196318 [Gymnopus androsaceus JB14]|uniref:Uncharacterized protein n=1 Tax=Gymnopus androsaceus JB14 TaxID=1447944 RepID=A0A6A4HAG3_9AGAR|nr:hypothetical protein BT96DRAFT_196318 [Gymnopus androsaceus JB14]
MRSIDLVALSLKCFVNNALAVCRPGRVAVPATCGRNNTGSRLQRKFILGNVYPDQVEKTTSGGRDQPELSSMENSSVTTPLFLQVRCSKLKE